jgi:RNA polymerase sigma factor (sigma-70 family)
MLGSFDEAEDLVQETFLRAWRARESFEVRATVRSWLYRIATNAWLDFLAAHERRPRPYAVPPTIGARRSAHRDPVAAAVPGPPAGRDVGGRGAGLKRLPCNPSVARSRGESSASASQSLPSILRVSQHSQPEVHQWLLEP